MILVSNHTDLIKILSYFIFPLDRFVIVRLNANGTEDFENLRKNDGKKFTKEMDALRIQISNRIPVDESRLAFLNQFLKFNRIDSRELLFIMFKINPPNDDCFNQKSSSDV